MPGDQDGGIPRARLAWGRRDRVIRIFLTHESAIRSLASLLLEQDDRWSAGTRYVDRSAYWQWREAGHDAKAWRSSLDTP